MTSFRVHALPATVLDEVRTSGTGALGIPGSHLTATGGEPLRCCLRDAAPGERLLLFGYRPPLPASPYTEVGAVFAHARPCPGPADPTGYPAAWRGRRQVLRAYDSRGRIHPASTEHDGTDPEAVVTRLLADPDVVRLHSRNVVYGCFMFEVTR